MKKKHTFGVSVLLLLYISSSCASVNSATSAPYTNLPLSYPNTSPESSVPEGEEKETSYEAREDDSGMTRAPAYIDVVEWDTSTQVLYLAGNLSTPCHELRVVFPKDEKYSSAGYFDIDVYSVISSGAACADMLEPFEIEVRLPDFVNDDSVIRVNGQEVSSLGVENPQLDEGENSIVISNQYKPQKEDSELVEAPAYINIVDWNAEASILHLSGSLPSPCHQLRIVSHSVEVESGFEKEIALKVYSVISPEDMCADMIQPFNADLLIDNSVEEIKSVLINDEVFFP